MMIRNLDTADLAIYYALLFPKLLLWALMLNNLISK
ncbi:MAG: hypothetical protein HLUCCA11_00415 [Phormidesmis priestleyi Ana]|uniref:Uncharacterized protein n=1 Tax=Phormidesmis priestleyi Ana TaxID=1666911 RepID=A0A0P8BU00_9CYAN|nr:MAG: hypothetical protein HLUCCA11_00415 [Phormidesmis priestleyi Ana]